MTPYLILAALPLILGGAILSSLKRQSWVLVFAFVGMTGAIAIAVLESLGQPRPYVTEWRDLEGANVLASLPREGVAIYVWVLLPSGGEPRVYALPWSEKAASEQYEAEQKATVGKTGLSMRHADGKDGGEIMFYPDPQVAMAVKQKSP